MSKYLDSNVSRKAPKHVSQTVGQTKQGGSMVVSPDSFLANGDSNLLQIDSTEEEPSVQEIKNFTADSPMKANKLSIENFISDLIIEDTPGNEIIPNVDQAVNQATEEDSFLEFIKEKPVIGLSPQSNNNSPSMQIQDSIIEKGSFAITPRNRRGLATGRSQERSVLPPDVQGLFKCDESSEEEKKSRRKVNNSLRGSRTVKS
jgi:hypothetical protein